MTTPWWDDNKGHEMQIGGFYGDNGLEQLYFWCRTCDPQGEQLEVVDVTDKDANDIAAVYSKFSMLKNQHKQRAITKV